MRLEVLLSVMNLDKKELEKMNITSKCIVINQCNKEEHIKYKNYDIYSYKEKGVSNSRNKALEHSKEEILLFSDNDLVYYKDYEKKIIEEFKNNKEADVIIFNVVNIGRKKRILNKRKRLHIYNSLNYATYNIAVRRKSIINNNISFNILFGPGGKYSNGSDTMFIVDMLKNKLKIYSSSYIIGECHNKKSNWFKGYDEKYFYNKGALYTAVSKRFRHILMFQHILRHRYILTDFSFFKAYRIMNKGSKEYLHDISSS